jgi:hypothetical protein
LIQAVRELVCTRITTPDASTYQLSSYRSIAGRDIGRAIVADLLLGFDGRFGLFPGGSADASAVQIDPRTKRAVVLRTMLVPPATSSARPSFEDLCSKKFERTADDYGFGDENGAGDGSGGGDTSEAAGTEVEPVVPAEPPTREEKIKARAEKQLNKAFSLFGATRRKSKEDASPEPPKEEPVPDPVVNTFDRTRLVNDLLAQ